MSKITTIILVAVIAIILCAIFLPEDLFDSDLPTSYEDAAVTTLSEGVYKAEISAKGKEGKLLAISDLVGRGYLIQVGWTATSNGRIGYQKYVYCLSISDDGNSYWCSAAPAIAQARRSSFVLISGGGNGTIYCIPRQANWDGTVNMETIKKIGKVWRRLKDE